MTVTLNSWQQLILNLGFPIALFFALGLFAWRRAWPEYVTRRNNEVQEAVNRELYHREHLDQLRQFLAENARVNAGMVTALEAVRQSVEDGRREAIEQHRFIESTIAGIRPARPKEL